LDDNILGKIFSAAAGVWTMVAMVAVALFKAWPGIMERTNERRRDAATEKAGDWDRLRVERDRLRELLTQCERERLEWQGRAVIAEATLLGLGTARQQLAVIEAKERLIDKDGGND
jgi:hypothetical protein